MEHLYTPLKSLLFSILIFSFVACDSTSPGDQMNPEDGVGAYMNALPAWSAFSPLEQAQPPTAVGDPENLPDVVLDVEVVDEQGNVQILPDVTYTCQSQPYSMKDNPEQIAVYSPNRNILWAGALIQGKSHAEGLGSLLPLQINERAPLSVSIPTIPSGDNFREVANPSQALVDAAIGEMVGNATRSGLATPSTISFELNEYHAEDQFALQVGLSGRYLNFEGSANDRLKLPTPCSARISQRLNCNSR